MARSPEALSDWQSCGAMRGHYAHTVHLGQLPEPVAVPTRECLAACAAGQVRASASCSALQKPRGMSSSGLTSASKHASVISLYGTPQDNRWIAELYRADLGNPKQLSVSLPALAPGIYAVKISRALGGQPHCRRPVLLHRAGKSMIDVAIVLRIIHLGAAIALAGSCTLHSWWHDQPLPGQSRGLACLAAH